MGLGQPRNVEWVSVFIFTLTFIEKHVHCSEYVYMQQLIPI